MEDYNRKYDVTDAVVPTITPVSPTPSASSPFQRPICEQVIHEVSSDETPESDTNDNDLNRTCERIDIRVPPQRCSSFKLKEPSSESDFLDSDVTLPSFGSDKERRYDANLQIASLMKGVSPLPSFEQTASPIGRLEMDLDDLGSLHKFVYYSDEEVLDDGDEMERSDSGTPETFLLKKRGAYKIRERL